MLSIKNNISKEYIINKSKFITKLYFINDTEEIKKILTELKKEYKDATHICYAYIIEQEKKASDSGEPNGTAGIPMLNVLEKNNLTHTLAVIIRYFGGIKLGANGLVRAYSNCLSQTIENVEIKNLEEAITLEITYDYNRSKQIENILENYEIINKDFNEEVTILIILPIDFYEEKKEILSNLCNKIIEKKHLLI